MTLTGLWRRVLDTARGSIGGTATDQILSTLSNLVVSVAVSRLAGAQALGSFTLVFTTATLLVGFQRSLIADPLLTLPVTPAGVGSARPDPEPAAVTSAVVFAAALGLLVAVAGVVGSSGLLVVMAAVTPGLLLQDLFRYAAFRRQRAWQAAGLDLVWVIGVCVGVPFLVASRSAEVGVAVWGVGAWLAVVVHLVRRQVAFSSLPVAKRWWVRDARRMGGLLAFDSIVYTAANQAATYGLAIIVGLRGLGEVRSAQIVLGPTGIALTALQLYALPRLAGRAHDGPRRAAMLSGAAVSLATFLVVAAVIFAHLLGVQILGSPLRGGLDLLPPMAVSVVLAAATVGPLLSLKALREVGAYSVTHLLAAGVGVPCMLLAADLEGLRAAMWVAAAQAALDLLGVVLALRYVERQRARRPGEASPHDPSLVAADAT